MQQPPELPRVDFQALIAAEHGIRSASLTRGVNIGESFGVALLCGERQLLLPRCARRADGR